MLSAWHLWIILAILLFIAEIFAPSFVLASFGVGCLLSSLSALLGLGLKTQIVGFIAGTLAAFFWVRPLFTKYAYKAAGQVRTNVDALMGKVGRVTETVSEDLNTGRVAVGGDDWKAISVDGSVLEKDTRVEVVRVEGAKVYVRPMQT